MILRPGERIDDRFEILAEAGAGGMGTVYRARDAVDDAPVALKVLHPNAPLERFEREARVLADLQHPGIVRYVAHRADHGAPAYLAMEWLEGEDLDSRLRRGALTVAETLDLVRRVSLALGVGHAKGMIHRDIKPSNLFLVGGRLDRPKILDFGIALGGWDATRQTATGALLGTPGYMAPEQVRGEIDVDARADVFSLGCVAFECLTGGPAFHGQHVTAILAKILFEDAPRVRDLAPDVPTDVEALVAMLLAKDRSARPLDASRVAAAIEALGGHAAGSIPPRAMPANLSASEQRLVSVAVLSRIDADPATTDASRVGLDPILAVVRRFGARVELLADGDAVAVLAGVGTATNQATRAAGFALALRAEAPHAAIALATGRAELSARGTVGEAIDRAVALARARDEGRAGVWIDEVTHALLDGSFERAQRSAAIELLGRRDSDEVRTLLGRPTTCVGRETELAMLHAELELTIAEPSSRAVVIAAPAGTGKSRLRHEFLRSVRARTEPVSVWIARGEPVGGGSAFGMAADALRREAGVRDVTTDDARRAALASHVASLVPEEHRRRVTAFLGEMLGVPFDDAHDVALRAARRDPMLMNDQIRRAFVDLVEACTRRGPLVVVLEDLHWGDLPTVQLVDAALRLLPNRALFVIALARPEIDAVFPALWADREVRRVNLAGLTRRAAERFVRASLGRSIADDRVAALVERAGGNAFYLEELIRAVAEGKADELPETIVGMAEARLQGIDAEGRRVLRAASVFGAVFSIDGVRALVGPSSWDGVARSLERLEQQELITRRTSGARAAGEHAFRHALFRDAAYAMLTDADRVLGHRLAAAWLAAGASCDPVVLAEHREKGGDPSGATSAYLAAAQQSLDGGDLDAAVVRAQRGVALGAQGAALAALLATQAEAHHWRARLADAERCAAAALDVAEAGSATWYAAIAALASAAGRLGHDDRVVALLELLAREPAADMVPRHVAAAERVAKQLVLTRHRDAAESLIAQIIRLAAPLGGTDPQVEGAALGVVASRALAQGDVCEYIAFAERAERAFAAAGDRRGAFLEGINAALVLVDLGAYDDALPRLDEGIRVAEDLGLASMAEGVRLHLGLVRARLGAVGEGLALLDGAIAALAAQGHRRMEACARVYRARVLLQASDPEGAAVEAARARDVGAAYPSMVACACAALATSLLALHRHDEALAAAREAAALLEMGHVQESGELARLVYAEAMFAVGDGEGAREAIRLARDRLLARASRITNPRWATSFMRDVPENARTVALATDWLSRTG